MPPPHCPLTRTQGLVVVEGLLGTIPKVAILVIVVGEILLAVSKPLAQVKFVPNLVMGRVGVDVAPLALPRCTMPLLGVWYLDHLD